VAVTVTMIIVTAILVTLTSVIGSQLGSLSYDLPKHKEKIVAKIKQVRSFMRGGAVEKLQDTMDTMVTELGKEPEPDKSPPEPVNLRQNPANPRQTLSQLPKPLRKRKSRCGLFDHARQAGGISGICVDRAFRGFLTTAGLVQLLVVMMLLRWEDMRSWLISSLATRIYRGHQGL
jgi:predicted PurR-regulated permease PerM